MLAPSTTHMLLEAITTHDDIHMRGAGGNKGNKAIGTFAPSPNP